MHKLSYKTLFIIFFFLLISIVVLARFVLPNNKVKATWWNETWMYRTAVNINNTSGSNLTDFQVSFSIGTSALITAGKMKSDCSDIRVTDQNGKILSYWIEENNPGCNKPTDTKIWIKLPTLSSDAAIYVYYGNSSATPVQSGDQTFEFFDDFNTSGFNSNKWSIDSGSWVQTTFNSNGVASIISPSATDNRLRAKNTNFSNTSNWVIETQLYSTYTTDTHPGVMFYSSQGYNDHFYFRPHQYGNSGNVVKGSYNGSLTFTDQGNLNIGPTVWNNIKINLRGDNIDVIGNGLTRSTTAVYDGTYSNVGLLTHNGGSNYYNYLFVRKYASINPTTNNQSEELSPAPIAYWKMDEGSGTTTNDSSGQNNTATINNGATWANEDQCISGKCLDFSNGGFPNISANSNSLNFGTNSFTISAWALNRDYTYPKSNFMIKKSNTCFSDGAANSGFDIGHSYFADGINICIRDTSNNVIHTNLTFNNGYRPSQLVKKWTHYVFIFDRVNNKIIAYINGVKQNNELNISTITGSLNSNADLVAGTLYGWQTDGLYDEIKIYKYARTTDQIKQDYNAGKSHAGSNKGSSASFGGSNINSNLSEGLVGYWKFDESSGNTSDSSGSNNTAIVSGSNNYSFGKFGNGFRSGIATTNFITNPSFETGISTWNYQIVSYGSATNTNTKSLFGDNSLMVTRTATGSEANVYNNLSGLANSTVYYYSVWAWANTASTACIFTYNGTTNLNAVCHSGSGNWERIGGTFTSSATGSIQLRLIQGSSTVLSSVYFDGAQVEPGSTISPYLDGSMGVGYSWTGTANASTSIRTASAGVVNNSTALNISNNQISYGVWVYLQNYNNTNGVIFQKSGFSEGYRAMLDPNGKVTLGVGESMGGSIVTNAVIPLKTWTHVALSYDGQKLSSYINGRLDNTKNYTNNIVASTSGITLGPAWYPNISGYIDELRIYNRALSASEMSSLYDYSPGPIAYYNFEEKSGTTVKDVSGNSRNVSWTGTGSWTNGKIGSAGNFNGSNSYLSATYTAPGIGKPFTMSAWMKTSVAHGYAPGIVSFGYSPIITMQTDGIIRAWWYDGVSYPAIVSTKVCNDGIFHYVTLSYDGSTAKLYVDGILQSSVVSTINSIYENLDIGVEKNSGYKLFNGQIDEAKFYNYARTQKQILEDMNGGSVSTSKSAVGWWKFDEGSGTITNNSGPQGSILNGTFNNSPVWSIDGKLNKALQFSDSGSVHFVSIPGNSALQDLTENNYTFSLWMKPSTSAYSQFAFSRPGNHTGISYGTNQRIYFDIWNDSSTTFSAVSTETYLPNKWYYVAATMDTQNKIAKLYINGKYNSSTSYTGSLRDYGTTQYLIGSAYNSGLCSDPYRYCFNGLVDEVKIFNYTLSADEIKQDYNLSASTNFGVSTQTIGGTTTSLDYCIPGDSSHCAAPVAEWKMEERTGTSIADTSGNNNTGTLGAGNSAPTWTQGKIGSGLNFDGIKTFMTATDTNFPSGNSSRTVEIWLKTTFNVATNSWNHIFNYGTSGSTNSWFTIAIASSTDADCGTNNSFSVSQWGDAICGNTSINDGRWHHGAVTYDGSTYKIYVDGIFQKSGSMTTNTTNNGTTYFGRYSSGDFFNGSIDQIRIYNYARTPAQIAYDYNQGAPIAWWKLDECQGNIAKNSADVGTTGTIIIGPSGTQNSLGTCQVGTSTAWTNGANGKLNGSLNFDGMDDYISGISSSSLSNIKDGLISFWIYPKGRGLYSGNNQEIKIVLPENRPYIYGTGQISIFWPGASSEYFGGTSLPDNIWTHVSVLWQNAGTGTNNGKVQIFFNGTLKSTTSNITLPSGSGNNFNIGGLPSNSPFNGQMDDIRIYNYALTTEQIKNIYNGGAINFQ